MKNFSILKFSLIITTLFLLNCNNSDDSNSEQLFNCCSNSTLDDLNINNLDESVGVISTFEVVTANGDGLNDFFEVQNLNLYPNNSVTIYNAQDETIFSEEDYDAGNAFPNSQSIEEGTYRYEIVVENEQTFVKNGHFCLIKPTNLEDASRYEGQFLDCIVNDLNDPFIL